MLSVLNDKSLGPYSDFIRTKMLYSEDEARRIEEMREEEYQKMTKQELVRGASTGDYVVIEKNAMEAAALAESKLLSNIAEDARLEAESARIQKEKREAKKAYRERKERKEKNQSMFNEKLE